VRETAPSSPCSLAARYAGPKWLRLRWSTHNSPRLLLSPGGAPRDNRWFPHQRGNRPYDKRRRTYLGSLEGGAAGRDNKDQALVAIAAQADGKGIGRIRMRVIQDASVASLHPFVEECIKPAAW
jgi:hypothetical protein